MRHLITLFLLGITIILLTLFVVTNHKNLSDWQLSIEKTFASKKSGQFEAKDKTDTPVIIEWQKTNVLNPEYTKIMGTIANVAVESYLPVEMQFLKTYPELVSTDDYFKQFEPFFKEGIDKVDWSAAETKMKNLLQSFYVAELSEDIKKLFAHDSYFFVTVKDATTKKFLGYTQYLIAPYHPQGAVWCGALAVAPEAQKRGLGKILVASIFKIIPDVTRIMLCTRITNETALKAYQAWGFTKDSNPIENPNFKLKKEHWLFMEYRPKKSDILQKTANKLIEIPEQ